MERIPGSVTDSITDYLDKKIEHFRELEVGESIAYVTDLNGARRAVVLEARGRVLAYEEMKKLLTLK